MEHSRQSAPLNNIDRMSDFRETVLISLTKSFFVKPFTEQVELFMIPALSQDPFWFDDWTEVLSKHFHLLTDNGSPDRCTWLLYALMKMCEQHPLNLYSTLPFVEVLSSLTKSLMNVRGLYAKLNLGDGDSDSEDDSDDEHEDVAAMFLQDISSESRKIAKKGLELMNGTAFVDSLVAISDKVLEPGEPEWALRSLCRVCHHLMVLHPFALHKFKILFTLAFRPSFLHRLWNLVLETKRMGLFGTAPVPLLTVRVISDYNCTLGVEMSFSFQVLSWGIRTTSTERDEIVPLINVFTSLFGYLLVTIHDTEFYGESSQTALPQGSTPKLGKSSQKSAVWMPFTLSELVPMSLALRDMTIGLIELAFPESRPVIRDDYKNAVKSVSKDPSGDELAQTHVWSHIFRSTFQLVRQLYTRDTRRQFCPDDHWINDRITLPMDRTNYISLRRSRLRQYRPFQGLRVFTREKLIEEGPPLSPKEVRLATVLREMPYAISFSQRIRVFHDLVQRDKDEHQGEIVNFGQGEAIQAYIRRNFIYEDAFEKLSPENGETCLIVLYSSKLKGINHLLYFEYPVRTEPSSEDEN